MGDRWHLYRLEMYVMNLIDNTILNIRNGTNLFYLPVMLALDAGKVL